MPRVCVEIPLRDIIYIRRRAQRRPKKCGKGFWAGPVALYLVGKLRLYLSRRDSPNAGLILVVVELRCLMYAQDGQQQQCYRYQAV